MKEMIPMEHKCPHCGAVLPEESSFCPHCAQPECVISCMSGALSKDPETGHVQYDEKKCGSCFMCVMNCPYGVLKPDDSTRSKVIKCDFCIGKGEDPSCVKACPKQAIWVEEV